MSSQTQFSQTDLVFKFIGGRNDGCVVPVSTSKCLLGKDQNNNAKCAVFRSSRGTTIKSLDENARINGHPFDVCWLRQGDQLTIGNSILEVQQLGQGNETVSEQEIPQEDRPDQQPLIEVQEEQILSPLNNVASEIESELRQENLDQPIATDSQANATTDAVGNKLGTTLPTEQDLAAAPESLTASDEVDSSQVEAKAAQVESTESPVAENGIDESRPTSALEAYERLTNRLFDEDANQESQDDSVNPLGAASELSEQLNALMGDVTDAANVHREVESPGDTQNEVGPQGDADEISTEALLARVKNQLADSPQQPETSVAQDGESSLGPSTANELNAEGGSSLEGVLPEGSLLEQFAVEAPVDEPETKPEPVQQESVAEVLARMQESGKLEADFESPAASPVQQDPVAEATSPEPITPPEPPQPAADPSGEDDSVQAYMDNLFQRLRGGDASYKPPSQVEDEKESKVEPVNTNQTPAPPEPPASLLTPDEFKPKARAPERVANMGAMRELANAQARTAILLSQSKRRKAITLTCLGIVAFGLGMAGYTFAIAKGIDIPFMVGSGCVLISCIAGYRCASAFLGWDLEKIDNKGFGDEAMAETAVEVLQQQIEQSATGSVGPPTAPDPAAAAMQTAAPIATMPNAPTPPTTPSV